MQKTVNEISLNPVSGELAFQSVAYDDQLSGQYTDIQVATLVAGNLSVSSHLSPGCDLSWSPNGKYLAYSTRSAPFTTCHSSIQALDFFDRISGQIVQFQFTTEPNAILDLAGWVLVQPSSTSTPTYTPTATVTPSLTPSNTAKPTNTSTSTLTATVTNTATATNTSTPTSTPTPTPIPTLRLQYYPDPSTVGTTVDGIMPDFNIVNSSSSAVPLTQLKILKLHADPLCSQGSRLPCLLSLFPSHAKKIYKFDRGTRTTSGYN